jgi:hypothetical protein
MAKRVKHSTDRSRLVDGCGTILVTDRLTGGYKLVKRKRGAKSTSSAMTTASKGKAGRPKGSKNKSKASAPVMATKRSVGRPRKMTSAPVMSSAPAKTSRTNKPKVNAFFQAKANAMKSGAKSFVYGGQKYVATKTKTGMTIFKKAGKGTSMKTTSVMTTAPAMTTAPKGKRGRPKGSTKKSSAPQKARRVSKKMA